jgi:hypothetical protein
MGTPRDRQAPIDEHHSKNDPLSFVPEWFPSVDSIDYKILISLPLGNLDAIAIITADQF